MNRRMAISKIAILSIGAAVLPSCSQPDENLIKLKNLLLTGSEEQLMKQLAAAIIPTTTFIGADDINAHAFTLKMVDDCFDPEQQKKFTTGLKAFAQFAKEKHGSAFTSMSLKEKASLLAIIEKKTDISEAATSFYETTRRYTIQAFTSSKAYMTDVLKYKMVPGSNFKGRVPVKHA